MGIPCISVNGVLKNPMGVYDMFMALFCIEEFCGFICVGSLIHAARLLFRYAILEQRIANASPTKKMCRWRKVFYFVCLKTKSNETSK
jgi:hypothetical protein